MKQKVKNILAAIVYFLYEKGILHSSIRVYSLDETIDELLRTNKSMVRFGDAEIGQIQGCDVTGQHASPEIGAGLAEILGYQYDDLFVMIPDIFTTLSQYQKKSRQFWKEHLLFYRKVYEKYCNPNRIYGNAFLSRCYYLSEDKSQCKVWFEKIKKLWENKDIVVVEGSKTHNGVGNDLLDSARTIERIICPPQDAYAVLDQIIAACEEYDKDKLFLVSLGNTAKVITFNLFQKGYRVLDIGNLDLEYEWFLRQAESKIQIEKHKIVGEEANRAAGYEEYLAQVRCWIQTDRNSRKG